MFAGDTLTRLLVPRPPAPGLPLNAERTKQLLLLRLDGIGDNVCTWPALELLRQHLPDTRISLAVGPWAAPLYNECPWVDEVIEWNSGLFGFFRGNGAKGLVADVSRCQQLRLKQYDAGIDLRGDLLSIALLALIAPPVRVADTSRGGKRLLTDPQLILPRHEMQRTYDVACAALGLPSNRAEPLRDWPRPLAHERALRGLYAIGWDATRPTAAICPQALWPWKQWPQERFSQLAERLKCDLGLQIIWFLDRDSRATADTTGNAVFTGPLDEVAAALRMCKLAIANDSGLMHLAIAAGCKTVQLFGPGDAARFAHRNACTPLFHDTSCQYNPCTRSGRCKNGHDGWCMEKIAVDDVFVSCRTLVSETANGTADPCFTSGE
jgi:heptosyltransferase-2